MIRVDSRPSLVLATNNKHKVSEIRAILKRSALRVRVLTLEDFPRRRPTVEDQTTLEGNARKKAMEAAQHTGCLSLADDTGLFVKALRGQPGVYSARFAGPGCSYEDNCRKLLRLMRQVPASRRQAVFRTVAALATPDGYCETVEGRISGRIWTRSLGERGFGYDPVFYVPRYKKTFAQMSFSLKNKISHRSKAFARVPAILRATLRARPAN